MHMGYSFNVEGEGFAFAQLYNIDASYKDLIQVCRAIKKLPVSKAMDLLSKVERGDLPVEYRNYNRKIGHRRELGGKKGRYPTKAAGIVKKVLLNAVNNARVKQLDESTLVVEHAAANKQSIYPRLTPKGRRMRADYETSKVEIVLKGEPKKIAEITLPEKAKAKPEESKKEEAVKKDSGEKREEVEKHSTRKEDVKKGEEEGKKKSQKQQNVPKKVNKTKSE